MKDFKIHLLKTVTWRIVGTITTSIIGWHISGSFWVGLKIGGAEVFIKTFIYFLHERVWFKITSIKHGKEYNK